MQQYASKYREARGFFVDKILNMQRTRLFELLLLTILSVAVLFPALGQNRHLASREIRHAEIIREMAEDGNYLIPKLIGKVYYDKPSIMHAPAAILTRITGNPSMAIARTPSAVAGILGVLATYGIGRLLFHRRAAFVGAIALLGVPGYVLMAREARPDMILCTSILFSCLCLGLGMRRHELAARAMRFTLAGLLTGLGIITKGPYALLIPILFAIFAPFRRQDFKRPRTGWISFGLGVIITIALWAVPAYFYDNGKYLYGVISQRDLDISTGGSGKPFYYVVYGIIFTLPLSLFLPLAIKDLRRSFSAPLSVAGVIFLVISCVPKKRPHYMLPLYPFFILGIANSIVYYSETSQFIRRTARILIPFSIVIIPLYFTTIQPIIHPSEDAEIVFAKEVVKAIEPDAEIYCAKCEEELAWVGRQHKRIHKSDMDVSDAANIAINRVLSQPGSISYIVINEKKMNMLLKNAALFQHQLILSHTIDREKYMLFRLREGPSEMP